MSGGHQYTFSTGYKYDEGGQFVTMSSGPLSNPQGTYPVYKTNVPGIGLVVRYSGTAFPYNGGTVSGYMGTNFVHTDFPFDINLVKYGDIPVGARTVNIDSTTLPAINYFVRVSDSGNVSQLPNGDVVLVRFILSPLTFDILTATCDTPDATVNLGTRRLGDTSNREGGKFATPWTDASIRLTNCPVFYGTGTYEFKETTRDNVMTVTLTPGNATTSSQGIMPVDNVSQAATGVGIQLAYGTAASPQPINFSAGNAEQTYTMSSTQGPTYTIPLVARYIQTAGTIEDIMPGKANGKITYLINYY